MWNWEWNIIYPVELWIWVHWCMICCWNLVKSSETLKIILCYCEFTVGCKPHFHEANRKSAMESRLFHTKMWKPSVSTLVCPVKSLHLFFFFCSRRLQKWYLGLTAQISRASYHLNRRLRWFVVVLSFSFWSNFFFCEIQLSAEFHTNAPK